MPVLFPILIEAVPVSEITSILDSPDAFLICKSADGDDVWIPMEVNDPAEPTMVEAVTIPEVFALKLFESVDANETLAVPSNDTELASKSPVTLKFLALANDIAVATLPSNVVAVIIPPEAVIPVPTLSVPTVDTPVELRLPVTLPSNVVAVIIPASAVISVPTLSVVIVDTPVELRLPVTLPVILPTNDLAVIIPSEAVIPVPTLSVVIVDTPVTLNCCVVKLVAEVVLSVVIPLMFKFPLALTLPFVTPNPTDDVGFPPTCSWNPVLFVPIPILVSVVNPVEPGINPTVAIATTGWSPKFPPEPEKLVALIVPVFPFITILPTVTIPLTLASVAVICPTTLASPLTSRLISGTVVPIPTRPAALTMKLSLSTCTPFLKLNDFI